MRIENIAHKAILVYFIAGMSSTPTEAMDMKPKAAPPPDDPSVVLPMEAKKPGDYNFQATVAAPSNSVPMGPGKLGLLVPVMLNGLTYIDLTTGLPIPPPGASNSRPVRNRNVPPEPIPEPMPDSNLPPEPMPQPPAPKDHGRIMSVGRDPDNPKAVLITYQDGTVERVFPPGK